MAGSIVGLIPNSICNAVPFLVRVCHHHVYVYVYCKFLEKRFKSHYTPISIKVASVMHDA